MRRKISTFLMCFILLLLTACESAVNGEQQENTGTKMTGYSWEELQQKGQDDAVYCNLPENINGLDTVLPVCYDPVYDILYYVNYGKDFFIYGCKDGRTEKIADIPAKRLFCRNGRLYFMAESYDGHSLNGFSEGDILEYQPVTGQVTAIVEDQASSMIVYQDGIYYAKDTMKNIGNNSFIMERELKCYSFADGSSKALLEMDGVERTLYRCGEDFLFYIVEPYQGTDEEILKLADGGEITMTTGMKLVNPGTLEENFLNNLLVLNNFYTAATEIYYTENFETYTEFVIYNIEQKTEKRYPLSMLAEGAYIVLGNNVYFSTLQKLDLESGMETVLTTEEICSVLEWYTDGTNLYGLCNIAQDGDFAVQLRKIEMQGSEIYFIPLTGEKENVDVSDQ